jgi:hypothetical protein
MKLLKFAKNIVISALKYIVNFIKDLVVNTDAVIILSLATMGAVVAIKELPFWIALPLWIEAPIAIGIISVLIVLSLVTIMELRTKSC